MKKLLALMLSALLLFAALPLSVFAADGCDCGMAPRIYIQGINCVKMTRDAGTENAKNAFSLEADAIIGLVKDNKEAIWDMMDANFSAENEQQVVDAIVAMFDDCSMNPDGTSKYEITTDFTYPTDDHHKTGNDYTFRYDWRLDPFVLAEQLHDFIEYIKDLTGHDSVHLIGFSLGTVVLDTYFSVYGYDGIESCVWYCGAYRGVSLVGQLFSGGLYVDPNALTGFLHENTENTTAFNLISALVQGLTDIGITGGITGVVNKIAGKLASDGALQEVLIKTFGGMPALWSFVDDDYYQAAKDYVFPTDAERTEYAALIEKIDRYHYEVQLHADDIMENVRAACGKIGVISKYNAHMTPVVPKADICADSIIDSYHTSAGATFAPLGKTLGRDYKQAVDDGHNHLSEDGMVDASTCKYPEYTWFIKNLLHSSNCDYVEDLLRFIAFSDHQVTVFENEAFPQFVLYSPTTDGVVPLTKAADKNAYVKFILKIKAFFQRIFDFILNLFTIKK